jgi:hypothetical protein
MAKKEAIFIVGAIVVGIAVAGSLFLLYPDLMFRNTSLDSQSGPGTDVPVLIDPNDPTMTASAGNSTNSTAGMNSTAAGMNSTAP